MAARPPQDAWFSSIAIANVEMLIAQIINPHGLDALPPICAIVWSRPGVIGNCESSIGRHVVIAESFFDSHEIRINAKDHARGTVHHDPGLYRKRHAPGSGAGKRGEAVGIGGERPGVGDRFGAIKHGIRFARDYDAIYAD